MAERATEVQARAGNGRHVLARDVAAVAGVSPATVSLVVNGKADGRIAARTQELVRRVVDELGYRVDPVARGLATGRHYSVALVVPDLQSPAFGYMTMGVEAALGGDYRLLLTLRHRSRGVDGRYDELIAARADGIIYAGGSADVPPQITDVTCPLIVLDEPSAGAELPSVQFALAEGAAALADHLAGLGHRSLVYLTAEHRASTFTVRERAFRRRFRARAGRSAAIIGVSCRTVVDAAAGLVAREAGRWRALGATALVCASDIQAYGALGALRELGVTVPAEFSVASFDDLPMAAVTWPPLTAVSLPAYALGLEAGRLLLDLLDGAPRAETHVTVATELTVRQSSGPAPD